MVAPSPTAVTGSSPPCSTDPSWTLAPRRTRIGPKSARSTAPYQMDASASTRTSPTRVAVGAIHAVGLTCGPRPSNSNSGIRPSWPVFRSLMLHFMSGLAASTAEMPGPATDGVQRIQAVDRAIVLLKAVAASSTPPTVLELARRCGINRATAWRLLRTLEHHGLVDRDAVTQRYTVGYAATVVASAVTDDALIRRVRPLLTDLSLRTGEAVTLAVARRFNLVYVDQVEPPHIMAPNWLDKPLPLHATSGGKAFLAWLSRDERDAILPAELPRYTERTVTDRERLERELAEVRTTELALCDREYEEFSSGASAAVLNSRRSPIAVVNVWGPAPRNPTRRLREIGREAVRTADEIRDLLD